MAIQMMYVFCSKASSPRNSFRHRHLSWLSTARHCSARQILSSRLTHPPPRKQLAGCCGRLTRFATPASICFRCMSAPVKTKNPPPNQRRCRTVTSSRGLEQVREWNVQRTWADGGSIETWISLQKHSAVDDSCNCLFLSWSLDMDGMFWKSSASLLISRLALKPC